MSSYATVYFTIVTDSHLPWAKVLMRNLHKYIKGAGLFIIQVTDKGNQGDDSLAGVNWLNANQVLSDISLIQHSFSYTAFEFCNFLRPYVHKHFLQNEGVQRTVYIDADIFPCGPVERVFEENPEASVLVWPHLLRMVSAEQIRPMETNLLRYGLFNSGMLSIRKTPGGLAFCDWFCSRLDHFCLDRREGMFVDQKWLDLVPVLFGDLAAIVRNQGSNVGYWNLHERPIERDADGVVHIYGDELSSLHFSKWNPADPERVSSEYPDIKGGEIWREHAGEYSRQLLEEGWQPHADSSYPYASFKNGKPIEPWMRMYYHQNAESSEWRGVNPFKVPERFSLREKHRNHGLIRTGISEFSGISHRVFKAARNGLFWSGG